MPLSKWASRCQPTRPSKVAKDDNYRLGKVKANRKKLRQGGYKFKDNINDNNNNNNNSLSLNKMTTANVTASYTESEDLEVMFSLPAESAFVMCHYGNGRGRQMIGLQLRFHYQLGTLHCRDQGC